MAVWTLSLVARGTRLLKGAVSRRLRLGPPVRETPRSLVSPFREAVVRWPFADVLPMLDDRTPVLSPALQRNVWGRRQERFDFAKHKIAIHQRISPVDRIPVSPTQARH